MLSRKPGGMGGYAEYAFGKAGNYMANYTYGLSLVIANVAIGVTAVGYGTVLFDATLSPLQTGLWTIFLLVLTTVANFGGSRITGRIGAVTVWGVIIPVVVVSLIGWFWFSGATWGAAWNPNNLPFGPAVGSSIAVTLWAFLEPNRRARTRTPSRIRSATCRSPCSEARSRRRFSTSCRPT